MLKSAATPSTFSPEEEKPLAGAMSGNSGSERSSASDSPRKPSASPTSRKRKRHLQEEEGGGALAAQLGVSGASSCLSSDEAPQRPAPGLSQRPLQYAPPRLLAPPFNPSSLLACKQQKPFLPYGLLPHHSLSEMYGLANGGGAPSQQHRLAHAASAESSTPSESLSSQEVLPLYVNATAAPSRLPAHKPVRLNQPKHPLAPPGTPVYFKYGEEHYPEATIPDAYTFTESDGTVCRYITNFLVYNKRGERLLPIEVLDQPRHGALVLYGSLLPASAVGSPLDVAPCDQRTAAARNAHHRRRSTAKARKCGDAGGAEGAAQTPYPIRVELSEWCIDYGQEPQNVPFIWLISRWDVYYRLEKPAGRYIPTFATAKMKFEVSTRIIKTLQFRPDFPYRELVDLLTAATRQERLKRRLEERRRQRHRLNNRAAKQHPPKHDHQDFADSDDQQTNNADADDNSAAANTRKKNARPNWKIHHSLSSPEGTGVNIELQNGQSQPRTPWGAPFAVEGVRESTLLGLTEFLDSQMRNFLEGVGGVGGDCANLLETHFMQTLREKASLRRETMQLVEAKKRAIESMAAASGFSHLGVHPTFELPQTATPLVALQVLQPIPVRHALAPGTQVTQACPLGSPSVTIGFTEQNEQMIMAKGPYEASSHHQAMLMLKSRHHEERELGQLLQLLKEFSDPESDRVGMNYSSELGGCGEDEESVDDEEEGMLLLSPTSQEENVDDSSQQQGTSPPGVACPSSSSSSGMVRAEENSKGGHNSPARGRRKRARMLSKIEDIAAPSSEAPAVIS